MTVSGSRTSFMAVCDKVSNTSNVLPTNWAWQGDTEEIQHKVKAFNHAKWI